MKNLRAILIVFSICFISCNKQIKSTPQIDTNSQIKKSPKTNTKPSSVSKILKNDTLINLSDISSQKEFENAELKIREIDTITLKPYELVYGTISDKTTQKYGGSGIIILSKKKSTNKVLWHYFDPSDFPPHTFSFIDFNGDGKKDLYMYSGFEDVFNSSLFINQIEKNSKQPFTNIYNNDYSYCSLIDINKDNLPEIINTIAQFKDEDASMFIEIDQNTREKINLEYDRIIGVFDKYNFDYNMPTAYKNISINILDEINILSVDKDNKVVDITANYKEHRKFRVDALKSLKNVSNEFKPWIDRLIAKYK
ncbi:hypothetical protein MHTCC0001_35170 [Flavobacteriaceae bacterium MHTCC 0001]